MPIPSLITDLSQTAGSNYPAGSDSPSVLDDVQRAHAGFIAQLRDGKGQSTPLTLASATTTDIGGQNSQFVEISGSVTITSFGTNYMGIRYLRFTGTPLLTHNATALNINGSINVTAVAGDTAIAIPNQSLNGWNVYYFRGANAPDITTLGNVTVPTQTAGNSSGFIANTEFVTSALANASPVPVRQTVLSGTVDSNGFSSFGGSTGSTTVTTSTTLIATAANGFSSTGQTNRVGSITNPSWTSLSTNGAMYGYLDIASNGTCTVGAGTLAPVYQWGGTPSVTNGQFTFNIQEMKGYVGNGSTAVQTYRVYVGEFTVAGGVTTAIVWYQLMGRYDSGYTNTLPGTGFTSKNHNLGFKPEVTNFVIECLTAQNNFSVGDLVTKSDLNTVSTTSSLMMNLNFKTTRTAMTLDVGGTVNYRCMAASGDFGDLTLANWKYKFTASRNW